MEYQHQTEYQQRYSPNLNNFCHRRLLSN